MGCCRHRLVPAAAALAVPAAAVEAAGPQPLAAWLRRQVQPLLMVLLMRARPLQCLLLLVLLLALPCRLRQRPPWLPSRRRGAAEIQLLQAAAAAAPPPALPPTAPGPWLPAAVDSRHQYGSHHPAGRLLLLRLPATVQRAAQRLPMRRLQTAAAAAPAQTWTACGEWRPGRRHPMPRLLVPGGPQAAVAAQRWPSPAHRPQCLSAPTAWQPSGLPSAAPLQPHPRRGGGPGSWGHALHRPLQAAAPKQQACRRRRRRQWLAVGRRASPWRQAWCHLVRRWPGIEPAAEPGKAGGQSEGRAGAEHAVCTRCCRRCAIETLTCSCSRSSSSSAASPRRCIVGQLLSAARRPDRGLEWQTNEAARSTRAPRCGRHEHAAAAAMSNAAAEGLPEMVRYVILSPVCLKRNDSAATSQHAVRWPHTSHTLQRRTWIVMMRA